MPKANDRIGQLTSSQSDQILRAFSSVRRLMRLDHWDLILMHEHTDDDVHMSVEPSTNHYSARICVGQHIMEESEDVRVNCVVHELLHLTHRGVTDALQWLERQTYMSFDQAEVFTDMVKVEMERHVSHVTRLLVQQMPPWSVLVESDVAEGIYIEGNHK